MAGLRKTCRITGEEFFVEDAERDLLRRMGTSHYGIGEPLPNPTVHPLECLRRVFSFGNVACLYRGKSIVSGRPQLTRFNPKLGYRIATLEEFWSDQVDNSVFGRDYDFARPFFSQFDELFHAVTLLPLQSANTEGSDYVNGADRVKNCYLCFTILESSDCLYCMNQYYGNDNVDCVGSQKSQFCYGCVEITSCYECQECQECVNCANCFGCLDCIGCNNCIGCVGLRNASYCIFNEPYKKEDYQNFLREYSLGKYQERLNLREQCKDFITSTSHKVNRLINAENCSGTYICNSKNLFQCSHSNGCQDCGYLLIGVNGKDCWRGASFGAELFYQAMPVNTHWCYNSYAVFGGDSNMYSYGLYNNCSNCFGCCGLKHKSYSILNKEYSKDAYFALLRRIISHMKMTGEWGEYFPPAISPHAYFESASWMAQYMEPISAEEAFRRGYRMDVLADDPKNEPADLEASELPDDIYDVGADEVLSKKIRCSSSGELYSIQKKEFDFYRRHSIPIPRKHWKLRLKELAQKREIMKTV